MPRNCLIALLAGIIAMASTAVAARESIPGTPAGETCAEKQQAEKNSSRASTTGKAAPGRETKAKPAVHGDAASGRLQSPRWHSFLPGMIR